MRTRRQEQSETENHRYFRQNKSKTLIKYYMRRFFNSVCIQAGCFHRSCLGDSCLCREAEGSVKIEFYLKAEAIKPLRTGSFFNLLVAKVAVSFFCTWAVGKCFFSSGK